MIRQALGIIETLGYIAAVEALDISLKSANVKLVNRNFVTGGLVNITISGDVGAVKAAIDSVTGSMQNTSSLISTHVIPRPIDSVWDMLGKCDENQQCKAKDCIDKIDVNNKNNVEEIKNDLTKEEEKLDGEESLNKEINELSDEDKKKL